MEPTRLDRQIRTILITASAWALFFYFFIRMPWLMWISWNCLWTLGLVGSAVLGVLSRSISREMWPVGVGCAAGLILGSDKAYFTDTIISEWDQLWRGITSFGLYPLWTWVAAVASWLATDGLVRWRKTRPR